MQWSLSEVCWLGTLTSHKSCNMSSPVEQMARIQSSYNQILSCRHTPDCYRKTIDSVWGLCVQYYDNLKHERRVLACGPLHVSVSPNSNPTTQQHHLVADFGEHARLQSGRGEEEPLVEAVFSWDERWRCGRWRNVLTPLVVTLIAVSNLTLLVHEARLVWRTQHIIQPKLLVVALCSAEPHGDARRILPLWVLFVTPQETPRHGDSHSGKQPCASPDGSSPHSLVNSSTFSTNQTSAVVPEVTASTFHLRLPRRPADWPNSPPRTPSANSVVLFLLTSFWTLAQCIVVVMGVERFLALRFPFFYTARCTCGVFLVVLGVRALVSCGVGSFHLVVQLEELEGDPLVFAGFLDSRSLPHNVFSLVQGLVWSVVLLLCNWAVTRELRRMEQRVTLVRMKDQREYMKQFSMVHGAGREFARFMMAVNVIFLLSSSPNLVSVLWRGVRFLVLFCLFVCLLLFFFFVCLFFRVRCLKIK